MICKGKEDEKKRRVAIQVIRKVRGRIKAMVLTRIKALVLIEGVRKGHGDTMVNKSRKKIKTNKSVPIYEWECALKDKTLSSYTDLRGKKKTR